MLQYEERAGKAFDDMSAQEKRAYLQAHPHSRYGKNGRNAGNLGLRSDDSDTERTQNRVQKAADYHKKKRREHYMRGSDPKEKNWEHHENLAALHYRAHVHFNKAQQHLQKGNTSLALQSIKRGQDYARRTKELIATLPGKKS